MNGLIEEYIELNEENDLYGTYGKAKSITKFIELETNKELLSKNNMIALYGEWGSGKSSVMRTIQNNLKKDKFETIWFDTWKYEKDDNLAYSLFKYIAKNGFWDKVKESGSLILKEAYNIFRSFASGFEFTLGDPLGNELSYAPRETLNQLESGDEKIKKEIEEKKVLWEKINDFEREFKAIDFGNKRLVVFLDDLDRCDSDSIIFLISSIKNLISINENIIFVLGVDKSAVTLALKNKYGNDNNKANEYLEKIFPINFELVAKINNENFKKHLSFITGLNTDDVSLIEDLLEKINLTKPRNIKKVLRKYYIIKNYLKTNNVDIENKYNVAIVLFLITLGYFHSNDYRNIFSRKESFLNNVYIYTNYANDTQEYSFNSRNIYCRHENYVIKLPYDIMPLLKIFCPSTFENRQLLISAIGAGNNLEIYYTDWKKIFKPNVCFRFTDFIIERKEFLQHFYTEDVFKNEELKKIINTIDNVL